MRSLLDRKRIVLIAAAVGVGLVLLSVFAVQLGIDHDPAWGPKRILGLTAGIALILSSIVFWQQAGPRDQGAANSRASVVGLMAALGVLLVIAAYIWFISLGRWTVWTPTPFTYYDRLASAFRHGQLNVDAQFDSELLSLQNPYDPDTRKAIDVLTDIWDMSLYDGKIYLYFGPAPALVVAALRSIYAGPLPDSVLAFAFLSGLFIFESLLILLLWRRFFADLPRWTALMAILVTGLASPVLWMLVMPRIYEAAIAAGQFFLIGGFYFALTALARREASLWPWLLAGVFWSFAVGTRATLAIPILFLTLMALHRLWRMHRLDGDMRGLRRTGLALVIPLVLGAGLIAWHNWARFGSVLETGLRYQITMLDLYTARASIFSLGHIAPNFYIYFLSPPVTQATFPFLRPIRPEEVIAYFSAYSPLLYNAERITGMLFSNPFMLFALLPAFSAVRGLLRNNKSRDPRDGDTSEPGLLRWAALSMVGAFALALVTMLVFFYATVRYTLEITPFGMLLAVLGFWQGYRLLGSKPALRCVFTILGIGLATASILVSVLMAFSSDGQWIRTHNPAFVTQFVRFFLALGRRLTP